MAEKNVYPHLVIKNNEHPNKLYAFPFVGLFIKIIMLIPVFIMAWALSFAFLFFWIINPFVILFTGKYWHAAYEFNLTFFKYTTKILLFILGLTDKYPGFNTEAHNSFELNFEKPKSPSTILALPFFGALIRIVLLIPYLIFQSVLQSGTRVALIISWFAILIKGKFPESLYEFESDAIRVSLASAAYITFLSDSYPSFSISMKHQTVKILLIIAGALILFTGMANGISAKQSMHYKYNNYKYNNYNNNHYYNNSRDMMRYTP
jgi:hypothetical protein